MTSLTPSLIFLAWRISIARPVNSRKPKISKFPSDRRLQKQELLGREELMDVDIYLSTTLTAIATSLHFRMINHVTNSPSCCVKICCIFVFYQIQDYDCEFCRHAHQINTWWQRWRISCKKFMRFLSDEGITWQRRSLIARSERNCWARPPHLDGCRPIHDGPCSPSEKLLGSFCSLSSIYSQHVPSSTRSKYDSFCNAF